MGGGQLAMGQRGLVQRDLPPLGEEFLQAGRGGGNGGEIAIHGGCGGRKPR